MDFSVFVEIVVQENCKEEKLPKQSAFFTKVICFVSCVYSPNDSDKRTFDLIGIKDEVTTR